MTQTSRGLAPIIGFAILTAALDVYAGNQVQDFSPATVAAISFSLVTVFFLGADLIAKGVSATLRPLRTSRRDVVMINVTTAVTWLSMLYALKFLEPAIVNVVGLAIGPLLTVLLSPMLRPGTSALRTETVVSLGSGVLIVVLLWGSLTGHSALGEVSTAKTMVGVGLTLLTGLGSVTNVIYSKRLSEAGLKPRSVLALRFFLIVGATWILVAITERPNLGGAFPPSAFIAVIGVGVPLYLLQVGIKHTEPITASILLTLSPLFAYVLQFADRRLNPSPLTLICVVGLVALVATGTVARSRHDARAVDPVPEPAASCAGGN